MQNLDQQAYIAALEWHLDHGANELVENSPVTDRSAKIVLSDDQPVIEKNKNVIDTDLLPEIQEINIAGSTQLKQKAYELAAKVSNLEDLAEVIKNFDGLDVKKTATNFVFSDGNPGAKIMLIGEAPGADEDRAGKPFVGICGQLLDKILICIGLDRKSEDINQAVYISNVLNWRPPGNRTPTPQEMDIALPFIEKHIALINPEYLIFCGGVAAQTLLHSRDSISKLRGVVHQYQPQTLQTAKSIPAVATYHPAYLLRTPSQKAKVWQDMLFLKNLMRK